MAAKLRSCAPRCTLVLNVMADWDSLCTGPCQAGALLHREEQAGRRAAVAVVAWSNVPVQSPTQQFKSGALQGPPQQPEHLPARDGAEVPTQAGPALTALALARDGGQPRARPAAQAVSDSRGRAGAALRAHADRNYWPGGRPRVVKADPVWCAPCATAMPALTACSTSARERPRPEDCSSACDAQAGRPRWRAPSAPTAGLRPRRAHRQAQVRRSAGRGAVAASASLSGPAAHARRAVQSEARARRRPPRKTQARCRRCPRRHQAGRRDERRAHHGRAQRQVGAHGAPGRAALAARGARGGRGGQHGGRAGARAAGRPPPPAAQAACADVRQALLRAGRDRAGGAGLGGPARAGLHRL